jgi:hypothetical protein
MYLYVLSVELALCHRSGAEKFDVAPAADFWKIYTNLLYTLKILCDYFTLGTKLTRL